MGAQGSDRPQATASGPGKVRVWSEPLVLPTYEPAPAERNPIFLEKRVFQGSSGRVYPLPFIDRIAAEPVMRAWQAVQIENDFLKVTVLPELGGRIHSATDKINGYDFVYRNPVIKPALVGLAGPWLSGGIEFNWPQHHRPSTYMPVEHTIEEAEDGSCTVWLSEHEPMNRMKGMHGVCLHPDKAYIELRVRLYNRTALTQTFMWWANVAVDVHERYQSFFPEDVTYVADHAKRAMSAFPLCQGHYYGVDYGERSKTGVPASEQPPLFRPTGEAPANDLRWYTNIPVPTSYMCVNSRHDFFGGYDHAANAGLVHVANHHISPGKKQWTWGNHEFGYAWDRNLTDPDENGVHRPYFELMAGVYTDNQPDFSFIAPGETKSFSQFWYPIHDIGPVHEANTEAAVSLVVDGPDAVVGVHALGQLPGATIRLSRGNACINEWHCDIDPATPVSKRVALPAGTLPGELILTIRDTSGREILRHQPYVASEDETPPESATEPPPPSEIDSVEELFLTGLHLAQYRHATRRPELYWREALERDPLDSRSNNAMGLHHLRRAEFAEAESCFRNAIARLRRRNPNPYDGEPFYNLGVVLRHLGRLDEAYDAIFKATWNAAWRAPGYHALAEIAASRGDWLMALEHVEDSLRFDTENLRARNLKAICLSRLGADDAADALLDETLKKDPLDVWAQDLKGMELSFDTRTIIDLALDYARVGDFARAIALLDTQAGKESAGTAPLVGYHAARFAEMLGKDDLAAAYRRKALEANGDYCFPCGLDDVAALQTAIDAEPEDAKARYYLGNLFYDSRRHGEAIALWERAAELDPDFPTVWRNLGIGSFNVLNDPERAIATYDRAFAAAPEDARVFYERDQLWKRVGRAPAHRLAELEANTQLVASRDDLTVELSALLNLVGRSEEALTVLLDRQFQPWEGGEGMALGQYVEIRLALGQKAMRQGDAEAAYAAFRAALDTPQSLGEARHLLANQSDVHFWLGKASSACGRPDEAEHWWRKAAEFNGDFLGMEVRPISEKTFYSALSWRSLGQEEACASLLEDMESFATETLGSTAKIDYFATSLPTLLIFNDDLQARQEVSANLILAQAYYGKDRTEAALALVDRVLAADPTRHGARVLAEQINSDGMA